MKSRKINSLDTSLPQLGFWNTVLKGVIDYTVSQEISEYSNSDGSIVGDTRVLNTVYTFTGETVGDALESAWLNFMKVKKQLALLNVGEFRIEMTDFNGNTYWDMVKIRKPITTDNTEFSPIIDFSFELISDHKGYYGNLNTVAGSQSVYQGVGLDCILDDEGISLLEESDSTEISYDGHIEVYPIITVTGQTINFQALNLTNGSRLQISGTYNDLTIDYSDINNRTISASGSILTASRGAGLGLYFDQGDNQIIFFDDSGNEFTTSIQRYDRFM